MRSKILFVSHDASRTGAPLFLLNQLRWLRANTDLDFAVILRNGGPLEDDFRALGQTLVNPDGASLLDFLHDIKLIYANTCTNGLFLETLPYGNIPILTHVHEMESVIGSFGEKNWQRVRQQTSQFVACSGAVSDALQKRGIPLRKIHVIHSAIPVAKVLENAAAETAADLRRRHGWAEDDILVMSCGVASLVKGTDLFLEVAAEVRRRHPEGVRRRFVWIGRLHEAAVDKFSEEALQASGQAGLVEFLGERSNPHPYLQAADIFCVCSREDSFPLVMLEAALLGKPVLCFEQSGGAEEFCRRGAGFAFPPGRTDLMAEKILRLSGPETELCREVGRTGCALVEAEHDIAETARRMRAKIEAFARPQAITAFRRLCVQFPVPAQPADYYEPNQRQAFARRWTRLGFEIPARLSATLPIRMEPADNPASVFIVGLAVRSQATGQILWRAEKGGLKFSRSLVTGWRGRHLLLFTPGPDGHFYLPLLPQFSEPVEIRCWVYLRPLPFWARWRHHFRTWRKRWFSSRKPPAKLS